MAVLNAALCSLVLFFYLTPVSLAQAPSSSPVPSIAVPPTTGTSPLPPEPASPPPRSPATSPDSTPPATATSSAPSKPASPPASIGPNPTSPRISPVPATPSTTPSNSARPDQVIGFPLVLLLALVTGASFSA